ncbi:cupin domain-containing protein [Thermomonas hydrothermalis]|uniref:50S ribosomal protein L16 3-hydroxylase n=1 Tax=Thermomonas hydrothermalis TaxID=213588 RepID=A0A1M4T911_9GAMM|nr:cupin domain-containing protein [Thermomonas hydrothermalis]SHE40900.1 50S ribosomal protein L16 3-hydroxylase [Thermomonas hydrothermalis]
MTHHGAPPIEIDAANGPSPLGMAPADFLRDYWQKRPLLIRNAFPGFVSPITPEDLAGLACEDGVLARLIEHDRTHDRWRVRHGPFAEDDFPGLPDHDWTLLVQDVDKWDADIRALLTRFDFLPRWRIDDIMISFAATGGSVGAHTDQYDVFLLQAQGLRRWQIDASPSPAQDFRDDVELKLLRAFHPTHDWVLGPGDMLYLPPGVPHHGVAETPCLTFSVGMRAPAAGELLTDLADTLTATAPETLRYADPDIELPADPFEIDAAALHRVRTALDALRLDDPDQFGDWFGGFITTYRCATLPEPPPTTPTPADLARFLAAGGQLLRHPWTRIAWRCDSQGQGRLYASGQVYRLTPDAARQLAAAERIDAALYTRLDAQGQATVQALVAAGHYLAETEDA